MNVIVVNGTQARTFDVVEPFVAGQSNFDKVEFRFDNAWDGMAKVAQFVQGSNMYNVAVENNECICPSELVKGCVFVRVRGYSATDVIATANEIQIPVEQGFEPGGVPPVPPTPDLYSKLVAKVQMEADAAKASADAAKADADLAATLAAEVSAKAAQTAQDATASAQAKEDAQTAQRLAETAKQAAETAKQAAETARAATAQSATDADAAKQGAESALSDAQAAASAAAKALSDIQELYQQMQTWAQGVIQTVSEAGSNAVQSVQSAGDAQVQRVADEGTQQTANAKAQADAAAQSAGAAEQSAKDAADSAAVYYGVIADVNQLKTDIAQKITAPASAAVGQTIRVKAVDDDGRPTEWEAADSVTQMWEKALEVTLEEAVKEFMVTLNKTYSSFIVFYIVPKNQEDTGENFTFWLTTYKDGFSSRVLDMNWFKPAIRSNMVSIGYAKVERNSDYFVEVENAAFANVSLSEYSFNIYNGEFYKNLVSVQKDTSFNAMRIREQGQFRFPVGSKFVIYGR